LDGWRDDRASRRVQDVLEVVGLADRRNQRASLLSGGEQQRTAIARALVFDPPIVLADEPTGNLDSASGAQVMDVLRSAQRELRRTVVVVTHDPRIAASADDAIELRDGRITGTIDLHGSRGDTRRQRRIVDWQSADE